MILIKNGTLHTAVSKEPLQADILVDGGKIVKIGAGLSSEGAEVIDASGLNVYPGFVEAHCHIGLDGYGIGYEGHDYNELMIRLLPSSAPSTVSTPLIRVWKWRQRPALPVWQLAQAAPTPSAEPSWP